MGWKPAVAILTVFNSAAVAAMTDEEGQPPTTAEFRLYIENDYLNPFTEHTDRYYTNGLRLESFYPSNKDGRLLPGIKHADWCRLLCGRAFAVGRFNTGYAVGQNMYTPADISIAAAQPEDRPWAGMLYVSRIARVRYPEPSLKAQREDRIEVSLGIVGPASLAKGTQIAFHKLIEAPRPAGWDHQLKNEPILQLRYETALRWQTKGNHADLIPRVRANLGNALTSLEAEVIGRVGWNLSGFGVGTIVPTAVPLASKAVETPPNDDAKRLKWFASGNVFLRGATRSVAHNILLDGNTVASNDIRIHRKVLVPEIAAGAELNLVGNLWLSYQFIRRGSEFESRSGRDAPAQEFGALTLVLMRPYP